MSLNAISHFRFIRLLGVPDINDPEIEVIQRPGVTGTMFRNLGSHGRPQQVISSVDVGSMLQGRNAIHQYKTLKGAGVVPIIVADIDMSVHGVLYSILDVRPITLRSIATVVGGINSPSLAWLECAWTVLPVGVQE